MRKVTSYLIQGGKMLALIGLLINEMTEAFWSMREFTKMIQCANPEIATTQSPKSLDGALGLLAKSPKDFH